MENTSNIFKIAENGHEEKQHGTIDFPCALYRNTSSLFVPWHWHDEYEISYVSKGRLCSNAGEESFELEEGEALFINSQVLHYNYAFKGSDCVHEELVFNGRLLYGSEESVMWKRYIQPISGSNSLFAIHFTEDTEWKKEALSYIKRAIAAHKEKREFYEFEVRECLTSIFLLIYQNCREQWQKEIHTNQDEAERIKMMLRFIHDNYAEQITLGQIAESANICERECLRCFQRLVRCSPIQYLIKYRILRSCSMLSEHRYSVTRVCSDCGFTSPSYFAKIFKRETGCTPRQFAGKKQRFPGDFPVEDM